MTSRGHRLPGFVELAALGAGAQGEVVLARHESGGRPVAIKYLAAGSLGDTAARDTFRAEAQMLKRVVDPHVARLLEYLESPWGAAIVLEAVAGRPLRKVLDEHVPGGRRQCFGEDHDRTDVVNNFSFGAKSTDAPSKGTHLAFYRVPPAKPKELPAGTGAVFVKAKSTKTGETQPYIEAECAYQSTWTQTFTLRVPGPEILAPGTYLVSTFAPMRITGTREGVTQEAMGTVNEGAAPLIEVLDG